MRTIIRFIFKLLFAFVALSCLWVGVYRWIDPPTTYLTLRDKLAGHTVRQTWVSLDQMSVALPRAAMGAEDSRFCQHNGFDLDAIAKARESNRQGRTLRGASTISQQTAKNVFLWPGRTMVRKGLEAWFTFLSEQIWGKARIMEIYLNVAEFGHGVYGAEAASQHYFGKSAKTLSVDEASRLAAILPQPIQRSASSPGPYTRRYASQIARRVNVVVSDKLDACLRK